MKLELKQDIIIPAGTIFDCPVPVKIERPVGDIHRYAGHVIPFGKDACATLNVYAEIGNPGFDEWFKEILVNMHILCPVCERPISGCAIGKEFKANNVIGVEFMPTHLECWDKYLESKKDNMEKIYTLGGRDTDE